MENRWEGAMKDSRGFLGWKTYWNGGVTVQGNCVVTGVGGEGRDNLTLEILNFTCVWKTHLAKPSLW